MSTTAIRRRCYSNKSRWHPSIDAGRHLRTPAPSPVRPEHVRAAGAVRPGAQPGPLSWPHGGVLGQRSGRIILGENETRVLRQVLAVDQGSELVLFIWQPTAVRYCSMALADFQPGGAVNLSVRRAARSTRERGGCGHRSIPTTPRRYLG